MRYRISRDSEVYKLKGGFNPYIYKQGKDLIYSIPVSSGHATMNYNFNISENDLKILRESKFRFIALNFILSHEIQSTFGTGHPNPRTYDIREFENRKREILYCTEGDLEKHILLFCSKRNLSYKYFEQFASNSV